MARALLIVSFLLLDPSIDDVTLAVGGCRIGRGTKGIRTSLLQKRHFDALFHGNALFTTNVAFTITRVVNWSDPLFEEINMRGATSFLALAYLLSSASLWGDAEARGPLAQAVQPFVDRGEFAGAVLLVTSKDKILDFETVGFADIEHRKPMRRETIGNIASTGKPMIAAVLMMLVDEGKIDLDVPVSHYLPDFAPRIKVTNADGKDELRSPVHPVTVRMLLNHTHGLMPDFSSAVPVDSLPLPALISDYLSRPLAHEPGTAFMYSGVGANVAARVIEVVVGRPFEDVMRQRLLDPLGMKDTTFFPTDDQLSRLALSYWIPPGSKQLAVTSLPGLTRPFGDRHVRYAPAGGLFSSAPDMARFAQLFLNRGTYAGKRYLSEASVANMTRNSLNPEAVNTVPQPPGISEKLSYGLGWGVSDSGAYFHPGTGGVDINVDASRTIAVVLLPQCGTDWSFAVRAQVMDVAKTRFTKGR